MRLCDFAKYAEFCKPLNRFARWLLSEYAEWRIETECILTMMWCWQPSLLLLPPVVFGEAGCRGWPGQEPSGREVCSAQRSATSWAWGLTANKEKPQRDPWSPATICPLCSRFAMTLATLLVPVPFSLEATDYGDILLGSCQALTRYWGGGSPMEPLHFPHH
jgi:hypothetical protein